MANFADGGKPNFYFEAKLLALQFDFEGKAKTGKVNIFSFGFEVNFLASLVYWVMHDSEIELCAFTSRAESMQSLDACSLDAIDQAHRLPTSTPNHKQNAEDEHPNE